jgi:ketosteroid isomerase-like protein
MNTPDPRQVVLQFNECINRKDLKELSSLLTENHEFIDREGNSTVSREKMEIAWGRFFEAFPEYHNVFDRVEIQGDIVVIVGHAFWSEEKPLDPVIWSARVDGNRIRQWRIYEDTLENRLAFHLD